MVEFAYLMVVLSLSDNGAISSSFVNTQTFKECKGRGQVVENILTRDKHQVDVTCYPSTTIFEKFTHNKADKKSDRYLYWLQIEDKNIKISLYTKQDTCPNYDFKDIKELKKKGFCSVSAQKIINNNKSGK